MREIQKGTIINNRYRVEGALGRGGMAEVYKVWDKKRAVHLAMKVLRQDLAQDPIFLRRFQREAKALAKLQHPNIVRFYGLERDDLLAYLLMEYIDGVSLQAEILRSNGKPLAGKRIMQVMASVSAALHYAHQGGLVHCDIKPGNILTDNTGQVYLTDFGIARGLDAATSTMIGIGTPAYMAPELIKGLDPTPQADIYALGIVLYEMLTGGERPFTGERATITGTRSAKVHWEHLNLDPIPVKYFNNKISDEWESIIQTSLSKTPQNRFSNVKVFFDTLSGKEPPPPLSNQDISFTKIPNAFQKGNTSHNKENLTNQRRNKRDRHLTSVLPYVIIGILSVSVLFLFGKLFFGNTNNKEETLGNTEVSLVIENTQNADFDKKHEEEATIVSTVESTPTNEPRTPSALDPGSTKVSKEDGMTLLFVPEGEFKMGSNNGDDDEKPVRKVYLDAFWIDETEVTNAMYEKCVNAGVCLSQKKFWDNPDTGSDHFDGSRYGDYPAVYVNWTDAVTYCEWVGRRLPTEAEWEKAARGTDGIRYPWGNQKPDSAYANFNQMVGDTKPVGSYPQGASPYGALDMAGNVYEWTSDYYSSGYDAGDTVNPSNGGSGTTHAIRGGSFFTGSKYITTSYRNRPGSEQSERYGSGNWGFRCVMDASP